MIDVALADELEEARRARRSDVTPPSARSGAFDLNAAHAVERELSRRRRAAGHAVVGRKVGYANKAVWRALKLDTLVWADMYDDTVRYAPKNHATLATSSLVAPKIEPEIVFKLRRPLPPDTTEPAAVLDAVEWIALGFEIIDCVYADWAFQPADFVASYGLHAALIVGGALPVDESNVAGVAKALPTFKVQLSCNGEPVEQGSGRNSLRSPALCVAELSAAIGRRAGAEPLAAGELVSSGTLTESKRIASGETWTVTIEGLELQPLTLRVA